MARGRASRGSAGRGEAWVLRTQVFTRHGGARLGAAGHGQAGHGRYAHCFLPRQGGAWRGEAGRGLAGLGTARHGKGATRIEGFYAARRGLAGHGWAWRGWARQGKGAKHTGFYAAGRGGARPGWAWHGKGATRTHTTEADMSKQKNSEQPRLFGGGVPTDPDVRRLMDAWPVIQPDQLIAYEDIAAVLVVAPRSYRFDVVVTAWRKRLRRDHNIELIAVRGVGLQRLTEWGRVKESAAGYSRGARQVQRSATRLAAVRTEVLSAEEQRVATHARRVMDATLAEARQGAKALSLEFRAASAARLPAKTGPTQ